MPNQRPLRIHWSPSHGTTTPDTSQFIQSCRQAEKAGIESVHVPVFDCLSDALQLALAAGLETTRIKFRVGGDSAHALASLFGHQLQKASETLNGRLIVHTIFSGDETALNNNLASAEEFLVNCRRLFPAGAAPQFDVEGESSEAAFLAIKQADCLWRLPNRPNQVYADVLPVLHFGKKAGLVSPVFARETHEEALGFAAAVLPEGRIEHLPNPPSCLWMDSIDGVKTAALIGSFEEVAAALYDFRNIGISRFMVREWPTQQEMSCFAARVLPLLRALERERMAA